MPLKTKDQDSKSIFKVTLANTAGEDVKDLMIVNMDETGAATTDVLQWGWTRADENNIFKFGVAYIGDDPASFTPAKIDLSKFKEDLKAVWRDRNKQSGTSKQALGHLVADLYYNLATKDTNMKKYALKIAWKDNTAYAYDKDGETIIESNEESLMKKRVCSTLLLLRLSSYSLPLSPSASTLVRLSQRMLTTSQSLPTTRLRSSSRTSTRSSTASRIS